ncbi:hypothetical protein PR048_021720 [Dryococelus australis]|uniref:Uncharacterized protein n=1 Tax=Dryococelus australis TaxID=614101 RepID=A0ABQ9GZ78_9NEOP|nr:hypothetical protein PR048_021720 [Dryococelus australis]
MRATSPVHSRLRRTIDADRPTPVAVLQYRANTLDEIVRSVTAVRRRWRSFRAIVTLRGPVPARHCVRPSYIHWFHTRITVVAARPSCFPMTDICIAMANVRNSPSSHYPPIAIFIQRSHREHILQQLMVFNYPRHEGHKSNPFQLVFRYRPNTPLSNLWSIDEILPVKPKKIKGNWRRAERRTHKNLRLPYERSKTKYNKDISLNPFRAGDSLMCQARPYIRAAKFSYHCIGPLQIQPFLLSVTLTLIAPALENEPSNNSPGEISGNHGKPEITMDGSGIQPSLSGWEELCLDDYSTRKFVFRKEAGEKVSVVAAHLSPGSLLFSGTRFWITEEKEGLPPQYPLKHPAHLPSRATALGGVHVCRILYLNKETRCHFVHRAARDDPDEDHHTRRCVTTSTVVGLNVSSTARSLETVQVAQGRGIGGRNGKESAMAFVRDPSQHSSGVILGNNGEPRSGRPD